MHTQTQRIRRHLLAHNSITPLQALRLFKCLRLAARIWELKKTGFSIVKHMVRRGEKSFAKYVMG